MIVARQISQNGMDVLTAVGLVPPDGHRLVLEAANTLDKNPRFYWLLRELWASIRILSTLPSSFFLHVLHCYFSISRYLSNTLYSSTARLGELARGRHVTHQRDCELAR